MAGGGAGQGGPELSVVIPTLGMYPVLRRVLDGYSKQTAPRESFEVVVAVDRADPEPELVAEATGGRGFAVRTVTGRVPGASANRNAGWQSARAPIVLFTDNDTIPTRRLVTEHLAWHRRRAELEVGVLGHVRWAPELEVTTFMRWLDRGIQFDFRRIRGTEAGWGRFYTANVSVKRAFLERVGDFEQDRLPYGYEDLDWAYRASKLGFRLLYNRRALVDHLRSMSLDFWKKRVRRTALAERRFVQLHPELPPYFFRMFSRARGAPPTRGRRVGLASHVPAWVPWLGPFVWEGVDIAYKQALAPHFLEAWEAAASEAGEPALPDLSERESESPIDSSPAAGGGHA